MRISVVIVTYNRASLLEAALDQLRHQRYEPGDEVIVVDNGSTDATADVIARASRRFPVPLRQLRELTPGKTPALNTGIAVAQGDILALTDDDVLVAEDWIATIRYLFQDSSIALVGGRVDPRWEHAPPRWLRVEEQGRYGPMSSPLALLHYGEAQELGTRTAVGANMAFRRAVAQSLGGFAPHLGRWRGTLLCGEDRDFCQRASAAGYGCQYRPELRVRHWVPTERTRLWYYLRWFFWSGITDAVLEGTARPSRSPRGGRAMPLYWWRQLVTASISALTQAFAGRSPKAAAHAMDAAFAAGYITQRFRGARDPAAAAQPTPLPVPDAAGNVLFER
jgi:glycosyltransferase involved in cell wall biosynthesis